MKIQKAIIFVAGAVLLGGAACSKPQMEAVNSNTAPQNANSMTMASHSTEKSFPPGTTMQTPVPRAETKTKWTQSGNPIDTTKFDADIAKAEKDLKAHASDEKVKKAAAQAYLDRGQALTEARQYASALGDYRKALKLDPTDETAKKWVDQIITIYDSINREYPPEGEEPPPLPFKKDGKPEANKSF